MTVPGKVLVILCVVNGMFLGINLSLGVKLHRDLQTAMLNEQNLVAEYEFKKSALAGLVSDLVNIDFHATGNREIVQASTSKIKAWLLNERESAFYARNFTTLKYIETNLNEISAAMESSADCLVLQKSECLTSLLVRVNEIGNSSEYILKSGL